MLLAGNRVGVRLRLLLSSPRSMPLSQPEDFGGTFGRVFGGGRGGGGAISPRRLPVQDFPSTFGRLFGESELAFRPMRRSVSGSEATPVLPTHREAGPTLLGARPAAGSPTRAAKLEQDSRQRRPSPFAESPREAPWMREQPKAEAGEFGARRRQSRCSSPTASPPRAAHQPTHAEPARQGIVAHERRPPAAFVFQAPLPSPRPGQAPQSPRPALAATGPAPPPRQPSPEVTAEPATSRRSCTSSSFTFGADGDVSQAIGKAAGGPHRSVILSTNTAPLALVLRHEQNAQPLSRRASPDTLDAQWRYRTREAVVIKRKVHEAQRWR